MYQNPFPNDVGGEEKKKRRGRMGMEGVGVVVRNKDTLTIGYQKKIMKTGNRLRGKKHFFLLS